MLSKKYFHVFQITLQEYFVYRLNFVVWRFRSVVLILSLYFFWLAVYAGNNNLFNYNQQQMLTYVTLVAILRNLIFSTRTSEIASMIRSGELSRILLSPVNLIKLYLSRDLADKFLNVIFSVVEIIIIFKLINISLAINTSGLFILLFIISAVLSFFLNFVFSLFLSFSAFWTEDVWATRWLFGIIFLELFSGAIFPLEILPVWLKDILFLTPFPYLLYFPIKILTGQITTVLAVKALMISSLWLIVFGWLTLSIWKKGIKNYGAFGG